MRQVIGLLCGMRNVEMAGSELTEQRGPQGYSLAPWKLTTPKNTRRMETGSLWTRNFLHIFNAIM